MQATATTEPNDIILALCVSRGGSDASAAFVELHRRHSRQLLAFLHTRHAEHAEDIAQEVWLRALTALPKAREGQMTNFRAWLFQIARNLALDLSRKKRPALFKDEDEPVAGNMVPSLAKLIDTERREIVRACLEKLVADLRVVIEAVLGGEKPEEIAERLHVSRQTIDSRKSRAIAALGGCVEKRLP